LVGCLVGGVIIGLGGGVKTSAFVFTSLLTIPAFDNIPLYAGAVAASFFTAMILVIFSGYQTPEQKAAVAVEVEARETAKSTTAAATSAVAAPVVAPLVASAAGTRGATAVATVLATIGSPVTGVVIPLAEVPDPVFSKGIVGLGVGVDPTEDTVYAPGAGEVVVAQSTGHAFGLLLDSGVELLIHVGIDTVNMKGKGFDVTAAVGDRVEAGTPLVTFNREMIEAAGYSPVTLVLVTNPNDFGSVDQAATGAVTVGSPLITVAAK
ncbi:PTS glucose transporter subunit IIA, partial [Salinibacterium sp.]|uniref:PTS sugar transporter subunit IIA n=1 Tax=Salinibacterium sp. TaxID=1915057 RepID=UPI00286A3D72